MPIPEHVRRQAMDAVSHSETTAQIRAFQTSGQTVSFERQFTPPEPSVPEQRPIPEHVRKQAMDAVSHSETASQIRLVRDNGDITAPATPSRESQRIAEKIAQMNRSGMDTDTMQQQITKDGFGREYV